MSRLSQGTGRRSRQAGALVVAALSASALVPATSSAATTAQWTCAATAARVSVAGMQPVDPLVADRTPCQTSQVGLPDVTKSLGLAPGIQARTAYATTTATPAAGRPMEQSIGSAAGVEGLSLNTPDGKVVIGVDAARSTATASCVNGKPVFDASSTVAGLTLNGRTVKLDGLLEGLTDAISNSPLGEIAWVKLNEQERTADGIVQRAAHIKLLSAAGSSPLVDVVIAESRASSSEACNPNLPPNSTGGSSTTGSGGGGTPLVPNGTNGGCGRLSMWFVANRRHSIGVRYGRRQVLRGRIVSCRGRSIVGARIDVYHLINGRKVRLLKTGMKSRSHGRLTLILPLNMTTRTLSFEYRGDLSTAKVTSRQTLRLTVRDRFGRILRGAGPGSSKARAARRR